MQKIIDSILELKNLDLPVYIAGHINPDDDSIGSCLGMAFLLESLGIHSLVLLDNKDKDVLKNHLYQARVTNTVLHDDYVFVAMDLNETYRLNKFEKYYLSAKKKINIDHHQGNNTGADTIFSNPQASSTCEIVYNIISQINKDLLREVELCHSLYTGILTDTKCFAKRLSSDTLVIAQDLINSGVDYETIIAKTIQFRTLYQFRALSKLINDLHNEELFDYVIIDKTLPEYANLSHNDIVKVLAEEIRKIDGIDLLLVLIKNGDKITAKVASNISQNAHIIATQFGGGGHKGEAGFTTDLTAEEILAEAREFLPTLEENS